MDQKEAHYPKESSELAAEATLLNSGSDQDLNYQKTTHPFMTEWES